ncbi:MAG: FeoB small GTPase domain-containing protein [Polyangiaceae bacterium]
MSNAQPIEIVLVGRPNAGKSAMFNRLTGGSAHVGNFPGVTVDILESTLVLSSGTNATLFDLPGFYSLDARLAEGTDEHVAYDFLTKRLATDRAPATTVAMVQVLDASQLGAGLRLTRELQTRFPHARLLVIASQIDLLTKDALKLDVEGLQSRIHSPVVAVSAREPSSRASVLSAIEALLANESGDASEAWDTEVVEAAVVRSTMPEASVDTPAEKQPQSFDKSPGHGARARSDRVDAVVLHPVFGPVLFVAIMAALFASVFLIADPVASVCDTAVQWLGKLLRPALGDGMLASMVVDGALAEPAPSLLFAADHHLDRDDGGARGEWISLSRGLPGRSVVQGHGAWRQGVRSAAHCSCVCSACDCLDSCAARSEGAIDGDTRDPVDDLLGAIAGVQLDRGCVFWGTTSKCGR